MNENEEPLPSDSFYIILGMGGGFLVFFGVVLATSWNDEVARSPAIGWLFLVGTIILLVVVGGAFVDLRKRYRSWKIEERNEELDILERQEEVEEKERRIKERKKKRREDKERLNYIKSQSKKKTKSHTSQKLSKENPHSSNYVAPNPLERTYPKGFDLTKLNQKPEKEESTKEVQTDLDKKYSQDQPDDKHILKTGEELSEEKLQGESKSDLQQETEKEINEENKFTDGDYKKAVFDSVALKSLWKIYKEPHIHKNPNQLYDAMDDEESGRKPDLYALFKKDEFKKLISIGEYGGLVLSPLGEEQIKLARKEKIFAWREFQERFEPKLQDEEGNQPEV